MDRRVYATVVECPPVDLVAVCTRIYIYLLL